MGYEKNMNFPVIPKSPKVWKKKIEEIGLGFFKHLIGIVIGEVSFTWETTACLNSFSHK